MNKLIICTVLTLFSLAIKQTPCNAKRYTFQNEKPEAIHYTAQSKPHDQQTRSFSRTLYDTSVTIIQQDITTLSVDVIVNAANTELTRGRGVCGAIFNAAEGTGTQLQKHIQNAYSNGIEPGHAVITPSFNLKHRGIQYIIHAVGPIYSSYTNKDVAAKVLAHAYQASLLTAHQYGLETIAFPFISSGIYGYPKQEAARIAIETITHELQRFYYYLGLGKPRIRDATQQKRIQHIFFAVTNKTDFEILKNALSKVDASQILK